MAAQDVKEQATAAAGTAVEQSKEVASTAKEQATDVAAQAIEQTAAVAGQAKDQAMHLVSQATTEAKTQANAQTDRLADGLRSVAGQIQALVEGRTQEAGPLPDYAKQATDQLQQLASRLGDGGVDGVVQDVTRFARRRPGVFLAGAAIAGFFGGRLLRGAQAASQVPVTAPPTATPQASLPMPAQPLAGATTEGTDVIVLTESATGVVPTTVGGGS